MEEYIKKSDVLNKEFEAEINTYDGEYNNSVAYVILASDVHKITAAKNIMEIRYGHWIENGCYRKCSVCNRSVCERDDFGEEQWFSFCPYCAARMNPNI